MDTPQTSFLDRQRPDADVDEYIPEDYKAFGISRKAWGGEPMINFISQQGNHTALPYSQIDRIDFNPSTGIHLRYFSWDVTIRGVNLFDGYQKLHMQRVVFVAEAGHARHMLANPTDPLITDLSVEIRKPAIDAPEH